MPRIRRTFPFNPLGDFYGNYRKNNGHRADGQHAHRHSQGDHRYLWREAIRWIHLPGLPTDWTGRRCLGKTDHSRRSLP